MLSTPITDIEHMKIYCITCFTADTTNRNNAYFSVCAIFVKLEKVSQ